MHFELHCNQLNRFVVKAPYYFVSKWLLRIETTIKNLL